MMSIPLQSQSQLQRQRAGDNQSIATPIADSSNRIIELAQNIIQQEVLCSSPVWSVVTPPPSQPAWRLVAKRQTTAPQTTDAVMVPCKGEVSRIVIWTVGQWIIAIVANNQAPDGTLN